MGAKGEATLDGPFRHGVLDCFGNVYGYHGGEEEWHFGAIGMLGAEVASRIADRTQDDSITWTQGHRRLA